MSDEKSWLEWPVEPFASRADVDALLDLLAGVDLRVSVARNMIDWERTRMERALVELGDAARAADGRADNARVRAADLQEQVDGLQEQVDVLHGRVSGAWWLTGGALLVAFVAVAAALGGWVS